MRTPTVYLVDDSTRSIYLELVTSSLTAHELVSRLQAIVRHPERTAVAHTPTPISPTRTSTDGTVGTESVSAGVVQKERAQRALSELMRRLGVTVARLHRARMLSHGSLLLFDWTSGLVVASTSFFIL